MPIAEGTNMPTATLGRPKLYDVRLPVKITREMDDRIAERAARMGITKSDVIRIAVDKYLEEN